MSDASDAEKSLHQILVGSYLAPPGCGLSVGW